MEFEFNAEKSAANQRKHGLDFVEAQMLWSDTDRVVVPARTENEVRWLAIGQIDGVLYSAVFTYRGDRIRLISARRSRQEEAAIYEG